MRKKQRNDTIPASSAQNAPGAPAPQSSPSAPSAQGSFPPPPAPSGPAPLDPPPTAAELYWHRVKDDIESNRFLFGGLLTISGSLNPDIPRFLRANGSPLVKLDFRELTFLYALVWHAFKRARLPLPRALDVPLMLPIESFMPVVDIIQFLDALRVLHPDIRVWEDVTAQNVYDVANGIRRKLGLARTPEHLIESEKPHGYRLSLPPEHVQLLFNGTAFGRRDWQP